MTPTFGVRLARACSDLVTPTDRFDRDERAALTTRLSTALTPYTPHVAVLDSIRALEQPSTCVALATARPGLFGSTLDALYAALHVVRLSQVHSRTSSQPFIPLLWIDTDKEPTRDCYEATFHSADHLPQRVSLPANYAAAETDSVRACLAQLLGHEPGLDEALELLSPRPGEHVASTLKRVLLEVFGSSGLLVCSPSDLRTDTSHFLAQIIAAEPNQLLQQSSAQLAANNFLAHEHPLFPVLVQCIENGKTQPLHSGRDGFCYADEPGSRTAAELAAEIVQAPDAFVPGQALLPLVQDLVLPVAVRVVDRETLYSEATLDALRSALDAPRAPLVPRLSCTLVDAATRESLAKLDLSVRALGSLGFLGSACPPGKQLEANSPAQALKEAVEEFRALSKATTKSLHRIARPLWQFDPVLRPVARRSARDLRRTLDRLCEKAENVLGTRDGQFARHQRRVNSVLVPNGFPQESVEYLLTWLAPSGPAWIHELLGELDPFGWEHLVVNFP